MAAPIRIGPLDATETSDLIRMLGARGLVGRRTSDGEPCWVEVLEAHERTDRLLAEVSEAVSAWLSDRGRPSLEIRVEDNVLRVEARDDDLSDVLRAQVRAKARRRR